MDASQWFRKVKQTTAAVKIIMHGDGAENNSPVNNFQVSASLSYYHYINNYIVVDGVHNNNI
jgi:hypothetical protein